MGRTRNWTDKEVAALVNSVDPRYRELVGKFTPKITHEYKENLWTVITNEVNSISGSNRSVNQVRNKFKSLKHDVKGKVSKMLRERRRTGGGESEDVTMTDIEDMVADTMTLWQKKLVKINGLEALTGIAHGFDSSNLANENELEASNSHSTAQVINHEHDYSNSQDILTPPLDSLSQNADLEAEPLTRGLSQLSSFGGGSNSTNDSNSILQSLNAKAQPFTVTPGSVNDNNNQNLGPGISSKAMTSGVVETNKDTRRRSDTSLRFQKKNNTDKAVEVGETMLDIQKSILEQTKSIADSLQELVKLKKLKYGINPNEPVSVEIIIQEPNINLDSSQ